VKSCLLKYNRGRRGNKELSVIKYIFLLLKKQNNNNKKIIQQGRKMEANPPVGVLKLPIMCQELW
jgi:hypothetical protein